MKILNRYLIEYTSRMSISTLSGIIEDVCHTVFGCSKPNARRSDKQNINRKKLHEMVIKNCHILANIIIDNMTAIIIKYGLSKK